MRKAYPLLSVLILILSSIFFGPVYAEDHVYAVQIGAFKNEGNAVRLVDNLKGQGYNAYLKKEPSSLQTQNLWNTVYIGSYDSESGAMSEAGILKKNKIIAGTPIIKALPDQQQSLSKGKSVFFAQTGATKATDVPKTSIEKSAPAAGKPIKETPAELVPSTSGNKLSALLEEGIRQYKEENYEEAIDSLTKVRQQDKTASTPAFFLGLAYKQTNDYQKALEQFQDAATLKPAIKEAVIELIDVLNQLERLDEAMKWIDVAEKNNIVPAKTAFLKGMILAKKGQYAPAIAAFEKSKQMEKSYTQAADFQIAIAYMADRKYAKAKERFQAAVTQDPLSDLASFARRYQDIVEEQSFLQRPLRVTLGITGQYDTNMLQEPLTYPGLPDAGTEQSLALNSSLRLDYVPILPGRWLFNAGYGAVSRLHEKNSTRYDLLANTFNAAPGYDFGRFALNLSGNYTFVLKRGDYDNNGGGYRRYSENSSIGPLFRFLAKNNHIFELYTGYAVKDYFKTTPVGNPQDNMSACGLDSYLSWMWLFQNGGLFNARFSFNVDNADGIYWDNRSYKLTANMIYPVWKKINLQLGGEYTLAPYAYENQYFNNNVRLDQIFTGIIGFNWYINRNITGLIQYTGTRANSNIYIYDYSRSLWSAGVELRF